MTILQFMTHGAEPMTKKTKHWAATAAKAARKTLKKGTSTLFRQLVRVEKCRGDKVWLVVPGLDAGVYEVDRHIFPKVFRKRIVKGFRFLALVDMRSGASSSALKIYPPFEPGGRPANIRVTERKLLAGPPKPRPVDIADVQVSLMADLIREDHEGCNHEVGHCQHSDAFALLYQLEQQTKADPLVVKSAGIPPTLRPEEVKDALRDLQLTKEFIERLLYASLGSAVISSSAPISEAINRLVRLQHLMWVADARLGKSAA